MNLWKGRRTALGALLVVLSACNPFGPDGTGSSAVCGDSGINTYKFAYAWKKVEGYSPPRTDLELESNFDLLIIEPGDRMCESQIQNNAAIGANYKAIYNLNVNTRTVKIWNDINNIPQTDLTVTPTRTGTFSFSGQCAETSMILRDTTGKYEKYTLYGTDVPVGSCDPQ